jgi:hypothetical protein
LTRSKASVRSHAQGWPATATNASTSTSTNLVWLAPWHHNHPDDCFAVEPQAECEVALVCDFAGFTPTCDLMRSGNDVAIDLLELRLCLFHGELLVSARLLKHLSARCYATNAAARRHRVDIGIEEPFRPLEIMRHDSVKELTCPGERHRRNVTAGMCAAHRRELKPRRSRPRAIAGRSNEPRPAVVCA